LFQCYIKRKNMKRIHELIGLGFIGIMYLNIFTEVQCMYVIVEMNCFN